MNINRELAKLASDNGICRDWHQRLLETNNIDELLEMYLKGIDFCLSNDYPSNAYIRRHFKGKMEHKGIHLDECFVANNERKIVSLGRCDGIIGISDYNVSEIFAKHKSKLCITAKDNAFVMIDLFDDADIMVNVSGCAKVVVNRYGGLVVHSSSETSVVKIIEKHKKTYRS